MTTEAHEVSLVPGLDRLSHAVLSQARRRLDVDVAKLRADVGQQRAKYPMLTPDQLAARVAKQNRVAASAAAAFSLPSIVPGAGTALAAVGVAPGVAKLLGESAKSVVKVGLALDHDLSDELLRACAVLAVLSTPARAQTLWGEHAAALTRVGGFRELKGWSTEELLRTRQMEEPIVLRWVGWAGTPLLTGLAPFGVGTFVASNWIQQVLRTTIGAAERFFADVS